MVWKIAVVFVGFIEFAIFICLMWLFHKMPVEGEGVFTTTELLNLNLVILQAFLAALGLGLALLGVVGFATLAQTVRGRAENVARDVAIKIASAEIRAYLDSQKREQSKNDRRDELLEALMNRLMQGEPSSGGGRVSRPPAGREWEQRDDQ